MQYSKLLGKTVRKASADMVLPSAQLLYRAGYIRESTAGRYYILPLGMRVRNKIIAIIREEMDSAGAQELTTPILHPISLWEETNRNNAVGFELMTVQDRRETTFVLGGTAEEMMVDLIRKFQISYKDLPCNIYQFSQKFRDELRARGGLLRVREFLMKDAYSFHVSEEEFAEGYENMRRTYMRIFKRLGLETCVVEADNGYMGGDYCHEFQVVCDAGEDTLLYQESTNTYYNLEIAPAQAPPVDYDDKDMLPIEDIRGEGMIGVEQLAEFLNIPKSKTTKTLLFVVDNEKLIAVAVRGGYDIDETKVKRILKAHTIELASEKIIEKETGAKVGYLGPLNMPPHIPVYYDESTRNRINFECGANRTNYHSINVNWGRDIPIPNQFYDMKITQSHDLHPQTGRPYTWSKGVEVGNIFQLGYRYSSPKTGMKNAVFIDKDGKEKPYYMGCYGIGIDRTLATIVEMYHDDRGIMWPFSIAPFQIHLVGLDLKNESVMKKAQHIYEALQQQGIEVLFDDRIDTTAGEKFADADLIGIPVRMVVSQRTNDTIEWKWRREKDSQHATLGQIIDGWHKWKETKTY